MSGFSHLEADVAAVRGAHLFEDLAQRAHGLLVVEEARHVPRAHVEAARMHAACFKPGRTLYARQQSAVQML